MLRVRIEQVVGVLDVSSILSPIISADLIVGAGVAIDARALDGLTMAESRQLKAVLTALLNSLSIEETRPATILVEADGTAVAGTLTTLTTLPSGLPPRLPGGV